MQFHLGLELFALSTLHMKTDSEININLQLKSDRFLSIRKWKAYQNDDLTKKKNKKNWQLWKNSIQQPVLDTES